MLFCFARLLLKLRSRNREELFEMNGENNSDEWGTILKVFGQQGTRRGESCVCRRGRRGPGVMGTGQLCGASCTPQCLGSCVYPGGPLCPLGLFLLAFTVGRGLGAPLLSKGSQQSTWDPKQKSEPARPFLSFCFLLHAAMQNSRAAAATGSLWKRRCGSLRVPSVCLMILVKATFHICTRGTPPQSPFWGR